MKIGFFGTGYIGLVNAVCFANAGYTVKCFDIDLQKISFLKNGQSPIFEPDLEHLLKSGLKKGLLNFSTDIKTTIDDSEIIFVAVGTSGFDDGSANISSVLDVAQAIAKTMTSYKLIVVKSTVPAGTTERIELLIKTILKERGLDIEFNVAFNPEFLREGNAVEDCLNAERIVVGVNSTKAENILHRLYKPFLKNGQPFLVMDMPSAEMTKYAANALLAAKISLMNELSRLCEKTGANIENVRLGVGTDHRIGPHMIHAGVGYGGSCFPKDVQALIKMGDDVGENLEILKSVKKTNDLQRERFIQKIVNLSQPDHSKTYAVWGVSFKPKTDDIRQAPALDIIEELLNAGSRVNCFDPAAKQNALDYFKNHPRVRFFDDQYETLHQCSALIIPTEWSTFKNPDFQIMKEKMSGHQIFDGRNIYNKEILQTFGFEYHSIGR